MTRARDLADLASSGVIEGTEVADDAITLAKMAGLARGKIIYGDSSGDPAALAVGTSGQALVSDGTDISWGAGGPTQANQAALEAQTNQDTYAPPDLMHHHPGVAKAWVQVEQGGTHSILASYNITSGADSGSQGHSDIVIATDFSSAAYAIVGTAGRGDDGDTPRTIGPQVSDPVAGSLTITTTGDDGTRYDSEFCSLAFFGDQ